MVDRNEQCLVHSGMEARIDSLEKGHGEQQKAIDKAHERIDRIQNWVIAGMSSLVMQLILWVVGVMIAYLKLKGTL